MSKARRGVAAFTILLVAIFAFWWGISVLDYQSAGATSESASPAAASKEVSYMGDMPILVVDTQDKSTHSYHGALAVPSCEQLGSGVSTVGSKPVHVTLRLTLTASGDCSSSPMESQAFAVSVSEGSAAVVFDGVVINDQIVPSQVSEH